MKTKLLILFISYFFSVQAQKEFWGINKTESYIDYSNPAAPVTVPYYGNISKFDINGQNASVIHVFDGINGKLPKGKLFQASNGKLYGTTYAGGNTTPFILEGAGVLFEYDLILSKYQVLHFFEQLPSAQSIIGVIEPTLNKLYGSIDTKAYSYDLITGQFTYVDNTFTGASINCELMKASNGALYATTGSVAACAGNGPSIFYGTISKINTTSNNLEIAYYYNCGGSDGINSNTRSANTLIETQSGKLYGTVPGGFDFSGAYNGIIFEFDTNTNTFTKKINFDGNNLGANSDCLVNAGNGILYGVCENGGTNTYFDPTNSVTYTNHYGTLFKYDTTNNTITKLHDFGNQTNPPNSISGIYPKSIMKASTGFYFGITDFGLFKFNPIDNTVILPTPPGCTTCPVNEPFAYVTESLIEICRKPSYQEFIPNTYAQEQGTAFNYNIQNTNASTYVWKKGTTVLPAQTTGILNLLNVTANDTGIYTCTMTNECGETVTMPLIINVTNLATETIDNFKEFITLYPNPTKGSINLKFPENRGMKAISYKVTNLLGQVVLENDIAKNNTATSITIDAAGFANGIYQVTLATDKGNWNGKFVKE